MNGFKVDFFWPDLGLVVETDGHQPGYVRSRPAQTVWHLSARASP